jgi:NAD(P)-dependent dehydrogenase (short-subunit alcohol dehydrogenase family)
MTRIALVTGANKGIGFAIAQQLADAGVDVVIGARDEAAGRAAAARVPRARFVQLDVSSADSVRAAAESLTALDVLVNNAGVSASGDGAGSTIADAALRQTFDVNFFGAVAVTQAMLPLLRRSPAGRIVMVSSSLARPALDTNLQLLGYRASKAAVNMFTVALARELAGTAIKVNAAAPGFTATDLNRHLAEAQPGWTPPPHTQTTEEAARVPVRLALLPDDGPTGGFFDRSGAVAW